MNITTLTSHVTLAIQHIGIVWSDSIEFRVASLILLLQFTSMLFMTLLVGRAIQRPVIVYTKSD